MRYRVGRVTGIVALSIFLSTVCLAQGNLHINESAIRIQLLDESTDVELAVDNAGSDTLPARVSVALVDTKGAEQSRSDKEVSLLPGWTKVHLSMPPAYAQKEQAGRENMLWYRLQYSVAAISSSGGAENSIHGVLSVSEAAPKLFQLHVAAPHLVKGGSRAAIRVRAVHPVTLYPVEGVTVQASIDLDLDTGDNKPLLSPEAKTNRDGFATLPLVLPRGIDSEQLDIKVTGKLGTYSAEADGDLNVNRFSFVMLSTDKSLYQPGQPLHVRLIAFDPEHKAIAEPGSPGRDSRPGRCIGLSRQPHNLALWRGLCRLADSREPPAGELRSAGATIGEDSPGPKIHTPV